MTFIAPTVEIDDSGWTDVSADVIGSLDLDYGLPGTRPNDRVARTGRLKFILNNSAQNANTTIGYYSPDHGSAWAAFVIGTKVRCSWGNDYKFYGTITRITPSAGIYGDRRVAVVAEDFMAKMASERMQLIAAQTNKRADQLLTTVIAGMPTAPLTTSYATGISTFAYALDRERDERSSPMNIAQKIALSERGYIYRKGNSTNGETLVLESRHSRNLIQNPARTFSNDMQGLKVVYSDDTVYNRIMGTSYPREVDAAATTVLATLQKAVLIPPGTTETVYMYYRNPTGGVRISGIGDSITHTGNGTESGSGADLSSDLTITATFGGNRVKCAVENTGVSTVWLTAMQALGQGIYLYDPVVIEKTDATSVTTYGDRPLNLNLHYVDDPLEASDFANDELTRSKDGIRDVRTMTLIAESVTTSYTRITEDSNTRITEDGNDRITETANPVYYMEIGDRLTLTETLTGVSTDFHIHHISISVKGKRTVCKWELAAADTRDFWVLGVDQLGVAAGKFIGV